jgi:L-lactate utilization protein LutB
MKTSNEKYDSIKRWFKEHKTHEIVESLTARGFNAQYHETPQSACDAILNLVPSSATIGIPGSVTVREIGIIARFIERGNTVYQHWKSQLTETNDQDLRRLEGNTDYYITGANALTIHGDIINIDGVGNRVADMVFGPRHVVFVIGMNKLVCSIEEGIRRSKEVAAVMNARRVNANVPCAKTGICSDCDAPRRICRVTTIIQYRPFQTEMTVMVIDKHLGF